MWVLLYFLFTAYVFLQGISCTRNGKWWNVGWPKLTPARFYLMLIDSLWMGGYSSTCSTWSTPQTYTLSIQHIYLLGIQHRNATTQGQMQLLLPRSQLYNVKECLFVFLHNSKKYLLNYSTGPHSTLNCNSNLYSFFYQLMAKLSYSTTLFISQEMPISV